MTQAKPDGKPAEHLLYFRKELVGTHADQVSVSAVANGRSGLCGAPSFGRDRGIVTLQAAQKHKQKYR